MSLDLRALPIRSDLELGGGSPPPIIELRLGHRIMKLAQFRDED